MHELLGDSAYQAVLPDLRAALSGQTVRFERAMPYRDGGTRVVQADYLPHVDSDGRVVGYVGMVSDVTELRQGEEAGRMARKLRECVHPGDRPCLDVALRLALDPAGGGNFHVEFRATGPLVTRERWLSAHGRVHFDARKQPLPFIGTLQDITATRRARLRADRLATVSSTLSRVLLPDALAALVVREGGRGARRHLRLDGAAERGWHRVRAARRARLLRGVARALLRDSDPESPQHKRAARIFIVQEIVNAHGGRVHVRSTRETGTVFQVRLPRATRG